MWNIFYRQPRLLALTVLLIVVAGLSAYQLMPRQEDPALTQRVALILTSYPGASAAQVESLVTDRIETELRTIEPIDRILSTSRVGVSSVFVILKPEIVDVDPVWSRVRDHLNDVAPQLPAGASAPTFDEAGSDFDPYALLIALTWEGKAPVPYAILQRLARQLEDQLRGLAGTKSSTLFGASREEIHVDIDAPRLLSLGLTYADVARAIARTDAKRPAGQLRTTHSNLLLEVEGALDSLARIRRIPLRHGTQGQVVQLDDLASISKAVADPPADLALIDDTPAVVVAVRMERSQRIDRWAQAAQAIQTRFQAQLPQDIQARVLFDQSHYVETRFADLQWNLLFGMALVVLVTIVMMGWLSALLVGAALPLSSLLVLAGMQWLGISIHQISITGLIIALGMLIDNAIIVVDTVHEHLRQGRSPAQAVADSVRQLLVPLAGSTITTALAFLPLLLMPGDTGEFVSALGASVILAIGSSLFVALSIIASLTGLLARPLTTSSTAWWARGFTHPWLLRTYDWSVQRLLDRPTWGVGVAILLPVLGFVVSMQLDEAFFPPAERDQIQIQLSVPFQASLEHTRTAVQEAGRLLRQHSEVAHVYWFVGTNAPKFYYNVLGGDSGMPFFAQALVQLRSTHHATALIHTLQDELDEHFPEAQVLVKQLEQGPPIGAPIAIFLYGPDVQQLRQLGEQMRAELAQVPDVIHTAASLVDGLPTLQFALDSDAAQLTGLDNVGVAEQLNDSLEGALGGTLIEATESLPVRVRLLSGRRQDVAEVAALGLLPIPPGARAAAQGHSIPLTALGDLRLQPTLASISHRYGERVNTIQGFLTAGVLPATVMQRFRQRLDAMALTLPPGYRYELGGEASERNDAVGQLLASVGIIVALLVATLVLSFQSFRMAGIIVVVAGLSVGLGLLSLWVFGYPFGFMAIIGIMGLVGLSVNDSIVVLAAIREHPEARYGHRAAIHEVILRSTRHVLTTTVTTVAGFIPLLLAGGGFWPPLAMAMAGGVTGATLLGLYFVPAAYLLLLRWHGAPAVESPAVSDKPMVWQELPFPHGDRQPAVRLHGEQG